MQRDDWHTTVDVVVVGSGAAGFTAAVVAATQGAAVLLVEKSELLGGTAATSGSAIWLPCSPLAAAAGYQDSAEEAFRYLRALADANVTDQRISAFVRAAPEMLRWMHAHTELRLVNATYPDYHPELDGAKDRRTHFPVDFDGRRLGADVELIREESPVASFLGRINWTVQESPTLLYRPPGWRRVFAKMLLRYYGDIGQRLRSRRDRYLTMGNALIGRLKYTADQLALPIWRATALQQLHLRDGRIDGVTVLRNGSAVRIRARRAVILAGGGFERSASLRRQYLPAAATDPQMSGSQINNTGDCIVIATEIGAATLNMDSAWWGPVFKVAGEERARLSAVERALPGSIMVNQAGRRYVNEAMSYHRVGQAMLAADCAEARTVPSYFVFDSGYRRRYPAGPLLPLPLWLQPAAVRGIVTRAVSLEQLAQRLGLPPQAFSAGVARFNANARLGVDPDFGRGSSDYDRFCGDARVQPNPSLAPLDQPPFYALPLYLGDIGTNGGLATDAHARVLDLDAKPIAGLYAAGNTAASVMGHSYPAAGATLGPALTFAFIAANHALHGG